jgi:hypothetical protein
MARRQSGGAGAEGKAHGHGMREYAARGGLNIAVWVREVGSGEEVPCYLASPLAWTRTWISAPSLSLVRPSRGRDHVITARFLNRVIPFAFWLCSLLGGYSTLAQAGTYE